jgi:hypothetical protein
LRAGVRLVLEKIEDAADVGMRDLPGQLHLTAEALVGPLVHCNLGSDRLQRDALAEREILGLVELSHAPARDDAHDAEPVAEQVAGPER